MPLLNQRNFIASPRVFQNFRQNLNIDGLHNDQQLYADIKGIFKKKTH